MKTILVGIDFSPLSARLADAAFSLAAAVYAKVVFLHVSALPLSGTDFSFDERNAARDVSLGKEVLLGALNSYALPAAKYGLRAECELLEGDVPKNIIKSAQHWNADIIVLGHHRHRTLERMFGTNVVHDILKESSIPLLLIPSAKAFAVEPVAVVQQEQR